MKPRPRNQVVVLGGDPTHTRLLRRIDRIADAITPAQHRLLLSTVTELRGPLSKREAAVSRRLQRTLAIGHRETGPVERLPYLVLQELTWRSLRRPKVAISP